MRVVVQQAHFATALDAVCKGISKDNTNAAYGGVLLETDGDALMLTSMNVTRSIRYRISASVEEPGVALLPGTLLSKTVAKMPDMPVTVETDGTSNVVTCGRSRLRLTSIDAERFGGFPEVDATSTITIPRGMFVSMASRASRCASKESMGREEFTAVHVQACDGRLMMHATDTYRMVEVASDASLGDFEAMLSATSMRDMCDMACSDEVEIGVSENQVRMSSGNVTYVSRVIEGRFPRFDAIVPSDCMTRVHIDTRELHDALGRVAGVAKANGKVEIAVGDDVMGLRAFAPDSGEAVESVSVEMDGPQNAINLSCQFMSEGLRLMGESTELRLVDSGKPAVMVSYGECDVTYVLMPLR